MFTAMSAPYFSAKISVGSAIGMLLLIPANDAGPHSIRRPGNESGEALSNSREGFHGAGFEPIGDAARRVLETVQKKESDRNHAGAPARFFDGWRNDRTVSR